MKLSGSCQEESQIQQPTPRMNILTIYFSARELTNSLNSGINLFDKQ